MVNNRNGPTGPDNRGALAGILGDQILKARIEDALTQAAAAVADAHAERDHWRLKFGEVQTEMVFLASILLSRRSAGERLVISETEFAKIPAGMKLHASNPEAGVRVYELRRDTEVN